MQHSMRSTVATQLFHGQCLKRGRWRAEQRTRGHDLIHKKNTCCRTFNRTLFCVIGYKQLVLTSTVHVFVTQFMEFIREVTSIHGVERVQLNAFVHQTTLRCILIVPQMVKNTVKNEGAHKPNILEWMFLFCDVHFSSSENQNPQNACLKQHAFWVDTLCVPYDYRLFQNSIFLTPPVKNISGNLTKGPISTQRRPTGKPFRVWDEAVGAGLAEDLGYNGLSDTRVHSIFHVEQPVSSVATTRSSLCIRFQTRPAVHARDPSSCNKNRRYKRGLRVGTRVQTYEGLDAWQGSGAESNFL